MKKIVSLACFFLLSINIATAQEPEAKDFLTRYKEFVVKMEKLSTKDCKEADVDSCKVQYKRLTKEASAAKASMTNDELKEYYEYKARYQTKLASIKVNRKTSSAIGWVKGVFSK